MISILFQFAGCKGSGHCAPFISRVSLFMCMSGKKICNRGMCSALLRSSVQMFQFTHDDSVITNPKTSEDVSSVSLLLNSGKVLTEIQLQRRWELELARCKYGGRRAREGVVRTSLECYIFTILRFMDGTSNVAMTTDTCAEMTPS